MHLSEGRRRCLFLVTEPEVTCFFLRKSIGETSTGIKFLSKRIWPILVGSFHQGLLLKKH